MSQGAARHRAALSVAYGGGLRLAEVAAPKVADIDNQRMLIRVEGEAAGRKEQTQADQAQIEVALAAARHAGLARGVAAGRKAQRRADQLKIAIAQDAVAQAKAASAASPCTTDQLAQQAVQETQEIQKITRICHVTPPNISLAPNAPP